MNPLRRAELIAWLQRALAATASPEIALRAAYEHEHRWDAALAEQTERGERIED